MQHDITYCNNRKCKHDDCMRFYKNAPFDVLLSWSNLNKKDDIEGNNCESYLKA